MTLKFPERLLNLQDEIVGTIRESINTQRKSQQLLEAAKRAVELAIEEREEKALSWLEDQPKENREGNYAN